MKFTVAKKMIALVAAAVIGMVGLALMSSTQMRESFDNANYSNTNSIPSLITLDEIRKYSLRLRININKHILNSDPKEMGGIEDTIKENHKALVDAINKYADNFASNEKDKQLISNLKASTDEMLAAYPPIIELSRTNKQDEARAPYVCTILEDKVVDSVLVKQVKPALCNRHV